MSIIVLKNNNNEPMIIGDIGIIGNEGIFIEENLSKMPKSLKGLSLGGYALRNGDYLISNTSGVTCRKLFKRVSDIIDFEPVKRSLYKQLEDSYKNLKWDEIFLALKDINENSKFYIQFEKCGFNLFSVRAIRFLKDTEIQPISHPFIEFASNLMGIYDFRFNIRFEPITNLQAKSMFHKYKNGAAVEVTLDDLNSIVKEYNLKLIEDKHIESISLTKERTNFEGRHQ